jgi:hypothetical protein
VAVLIGLVGLGLELLQEGGDGIVLALDQGGAVLPDTVLRLPLAPNRVPWFWWMLWTPRPLVKGSPKRAGEFLDVMALEFGEPMGEPEVLGQRVGLLLGRILGRIEFLRVVYAVLLALVVIAVCQDGVDKASHVVVSPAHLRRHKSLHQREPAERDEADRANHQDAVNYAAYRRVIPFSRGLAGGPHHTSPGADEQIGLQRKSKDRTYRASKRLSRRKLHF